MVNKRLTCAVTASLVFMATRRIEHIALQTWTRTVPTSALHSYSKLCLKIGRSDTKRTTYGMKTIREATGRRQPRPHFAASPTNATDNIPIELSVKRSAGISASFSPRTLLVRPKGINFHSDMRDKEAFKYQPS